MKTRKTSIGDVDAIEIAGKLLVKALQAIGLGCILHQEHECETGHEAPVNLSEHLFVESGHLLITEISQCIETMLDLSGGLPASLNLYGLALKAVNLLEFLVMVDDGRLDRTLLSHCCEFVLIVILWMNQEDTVGSC